MGDMRAAAKKAWATRKKKHGASGMTAQGRKNIGHAKPFKLSKMTSRLNPKTKLWEMQDSKKNWVPWDFGGDITLTYQGRELEDYKKRVSRHNALYKKRAKKRK